MKPTNRFPYVLTQVKSSMMLSGNDGIFLEVKGYELNRLGKYQSHPRDALRRACLAVTL